MRLEPIAPDVASSTKDNERRRIVSSRGRLNVLENVQMSRGRQCMVPGTESKKAKGNTRGKRVNETCLYVGIA